MLSFGTFLPHFGMLYEKIWQPWSKVGVAASDRLRCLVLKYFCINLLKERLVMSAGENITIFGRFYRPTY
jgi:hypothetical protein